MLCEFPTKHASNSPVTACHTQRFAVLFFLPSCCVNSITGWFSNRTGKSADDGKSARKVLHVTSGAQFSALPLVKPVVWFARAVVNWRSRSVAKSAYYGGRDVVWKSSLKGLCYAICYLFKRLELFSHQLNFKNNGLGVLCKTIYYTDTSVLLENIPLVKFIKTTSGTRVVYFP